jgi:hypothetical protein
VNNEHVNITPKAGAMREVMRNNILLPQYQAGYDRWANGEPKTYCNICTVATGELLGYDMSSFYRNHDKSRANQSPLRMVYQQLIDDGIKQTSASTAQSLANIGYFVVAWSAKYDHVVMICPDVEEYNAKRGPRIIQAGTKNTETYISDFWSFGRNWKDPEILYFVITEMKKDGE